MHRYKIVFEYLGTNFSGYQVQPEKRTVQGEMEGVLSKIIGEPVKIYASGRTDSGVHSLGQVAHFDTEKSLVSSFVLSQLSKQLPQDISVKSFCEVDENFDSRFSVKKKTYLYKFYLSRYTRAVYNGLALRVNDNVDIKKMQQATKYLVGTHDFTSFVARKSGRTDFVRTIYSAEITENRDGIFEFRISGNGFLYNMVRIIVGTLIKIGSSDASPEVMKAIIESKNRALAGKTVPPYGLYMESVVYE